MKRVLCLLSVALLTLTSCSNDEKSGTPKPSSILVRKIISTTEDGVFTSEVLYDGIKIKSLRDNKGSGENYTYTGGLITKIDQIGLDGKLTMSTELNYDKGKLISLIKKREGNKIYDKTVFTHHTDGTISYEEFATDATTGDDKKTGVTGKYSYKDGNAIKKEQFNNNLDSSVSVYEFDTKNNPFKNVLGYNLLIGNRFSNANNIAKHIYTITSGENVRQPITTNVYKYDVKDYPTELKTSIQEGNFEKTDKEEYIY